jgi:Zn-dependent M28 family amino/carboxypeptidase
MAALQRIADASGGNRAAATPGYAASARYVREVLQGAGYRVRLQPFTITFSETVAETGRVVGDAAVDLFPIVMQGSPNTPASGLQTQLTVPTDPLGCSPDDFAEARGTVVLIERGTCTFAEKSQNAAQASADAVLVYNSAAEPAAEAFGGSLGDVPLSTTVPTAGLTRAVGEGLLERLERGVVRVALDLRVSREQRRTANVIAELPRSTARNVVMVGAHLDSVPEGPGINDNGSGTALVLELALKLARVGDAEGVRFAFWGAEELGLLGSEHYVSALSPTELQGVRAYLNFDMVSSPNAAPFVYGDPELTTLFEETFAARELTLLPDTIGGASDHAPFEAAGVPVAGLFSGASGSKSASEVRTYGGRAAAYDPCYHQACDTLAGTDTPTAERYLDLMADAAAEALQSLLSGEVAVR